MDILEAIDVVCLNCVEDTLGDNSCCDTCPVRKTANAFSKRGKQRKSQLKERRDAWLRELRS